jgi:hypothetical protein
MPLLSPFESTAAWDVVLIGGTAASPGLVRIKSCVRKNKWDVKIGKGTIGATETFVGIPPAEIELEFKLWLPDHFTAWSTFVQNFQYDPSKQPGVANAIDIWHPALAFLGITSVVATEIGAPMMQPDFLWLINVKLLEYLKVPNTSAVGTANGSTSTAKSPTTPGGQPPGALDNDIAQLHQSAAALSAANARFQGA